MTSKANPAAAPPLVRPKDEIVILDFHVHNADHALGSCLMAAEGGPVQRHVMLKFLRDKKSLSACEFSQKRVGAHLGTKWLKHELKLFTETGKSVAPIEADITILVTMTRPTSAQCLEPWKHTKERERGKASSA